MNELTIVVGIYLYIDVEDCRNVFIVKENGFLHEYTLDYFSYAVSNILVGKNISSPSLELRGGYIKFITGSDMGIAVTGNGRLKINNREMDLWRCLPVRKNMRVEVESINHSSIVYISFTGDIKNMFEGALAPGKVELDDLGRDFNDFLKEIDARYLPPKYIPSMSNDLEIRVLFLSSLDYDENIFGKEYILSKDSFKNFILKPVKITDGDGRNKIIMISKSGAVQIFSKDYDEGLPLMAQILPEDLDNIARVNGDCRVKLNVIDPESARIEMRKYRMKIENILRIINLAVAAVRNGAKKIRVRLGESIYDAWIEEI